ncbi:BrnT family toxin [Devosia sp. SL43]|uniref:BrnT family toxin n=1 Tax=Devosia sp. SL43 TaxID=2806348 RepID=UPI001F2F52A9|nr:BrnT family toxin [Devosia sp. SL43]
MEFEWDENKKLRNLVKHGVYFEDAATVFRDPHELTLPARTVDGEERFKTIGHFGPAAILLVVHTRRQISGGDLIVRIISARPASRVERKLYERRES